MPIKILLADKSITIQKVVEMLFSGREYEVASVSDGEAALNEATRSVPDVVLADVDLPRIDGYSLAARFKKVPALAQTPVILMMSRDDVYEGEKGKQAGIVDYIAKPFESQELIGKVKKALPLAPPRPAEPALSAHTPPPQRAAEPRPIAPAPEKPKQAAPTDIFDIINNAPSPAEVVRTVAPAPEEEEAVYEVEPVVEEVEAPLAQEEAKALPIGAKAVEEMRAGLGLAEKTEERQPEIVTFESFEAALETEHPLPLPTPEKFAPTPPRPASPLSAPSPTMPKEEPRKPPEKSMATMAAEVLKDMPLPSVPIISEEAMRKMAEESVAKMAEKVFRDMPPPSVPIISEEAMRRMAEESVAKMAEKVFRDMPPSIPTLSEEAMRKMAEESVEKMAENVFRDIPLPPLPKISDETIRRGIEEAVMKVARLMAREIIEKVAWEVIPQLAETLIKEEIERLKLEQ
jgi:CheY-like chemotaxis protein